MAKERERRIEQRPIASLRPYERNARVHSPEQIAQIAASIQQWGWTMPVLADEDGMILAGHGRVAAAKTIGIETVPVIVARGWSAAQKRAYSIADNRLTETSEWDKDLLRLELGEIRELGFDLNLTGFDDDALGGLGLTGNDGLGDPDEAPELPKDPVTRVGDLWLLGKHRLLCGDACKAEDVARLLGDARPHLMVTDPPYGVNYDAAWRINSGLNGPGQASGKVRNDDRSDWREAWALFPGDVAYVWSSSWYVSTTQNSLEDAERQANTPA